MPRQEARQLLADLHRVGFLLYFGNEDTEDQGHPLSHVIFLRPEEIADTLYDELQLVSPTQRYVEEMAQKKKVSLPSLSAPSINKRFGILISA